MMRGFISVSQAGPAKMGAAGVRGTIRRYYYLTKPGIIYGNDMTAAAGYLLAARGRIDWGTLAAMLVGLSLVMASGCVFNNVMDRGIDAKMARTKKRAVATGAVAVVAALVYGTVLGVVGFGILAAGTTAVATATAAVGWVSYVVLYGWAKRRTVHSTLVGSIAGAVPPVVGYTAVTGRLDVGAWLVFAILVAWQMPHFYAIAIRRLSDYRAAGLPVLPVVAGVRAAKIQIVAYVGLFVVVAAILALAGYTGYTYLAVVTAAGMVWLGRAMEGLRAGIDDEQWARKLFGFSLLVLLTLSVMMGLNAWLP